MLTRAPLNGDKPAAPIPEISRDGTHDYLVWAGRAVHGWEESPLANQFTLAQSGSREKALEDFSHWLDGEVQKATGEIYNALARIGVLSRLGSVKLVCPGCGEPPKDWKQPYFCHVDVIIRKIEDLQNV